MALSFAHQLRSVASTRRVFMANSLLRMPYLRSFVTKKYTKEHEWVSIGEDGIATIGITDHAQKELGEVVYVDLTSQPGSEVQAGDVLCSVESVKAASDVYAPISGQVVEGNAALSDTPELVNSSAEGDGWIYKLRPTNPDEIDGLLSKEDYEKLI